MTPVFKKNASGLGFDSENNIQKYSKSCNVKSSFALMEYIADSNIESI